MRVGVICMKCSFPAGRTVWRVPKVVGVSSEEPIRILKLLKRVMMMITHYYLLLIFVKYLDVVRTEPAVTKLECWSMMTFSPLATPTLAGNPWLFSPALSCLCFILRSREYWESLSVCLWLKAQQMPESVGTGLKRSLQSLSLP